MDHWEVVEVLAGHHFRQQLAPRKLAQAPSLQDLSPALQDPCRHLQARFRRLHCPVCHCDMDSPLQGEEAQQVYPQQVALRYINGDVGPIRSSTFSIVSPLL